jgi:hypothetical protein
LPLNIVSAESNLTDDIIEFVVEELGTTGEVPLPIQDCDCATKDGHAVAFFDYDSAGNQICLQDQCAPGTKKSTGRKFCEPTVDASGKNLDGIWRRNVRVSLKVCQDYFPGNNEQIATIGN